MQRLVLGTLFVALAIVPFIQNFWGSLGDLLIWDYGNPLAIVPFTQNFCCHDATYIVHPVCLFVEHLKAM
jgi:hypothetical protein